MQKKATHYAWPSLFYLKTARIGRRHFRLAAVGLRGGGGAKSGRRRAWERAGLFGVGRVNGVLLARRPRFILVARNWRWFGPMCAAGANGPSAGPAMSYGEFVQMVGPYAGLIIDGFKLIPRGLKTAMGA
jgi:hypothetical protein